MLGKGPGIPADMVFLDLEDAVAPKEKEGARDKVVAAIRDQDWGEKVLCVRVNDWSTKWTAYDVMAVVGDAGPRLDEIMLPKVETRRTGGGHGPPAVPGRAGGRAAGRPHRDRGADRDHPRPDQRRGDLRRLAPAGDDHLRPGRLRGVDGDARAHRRRPDPDVPGRPLPLRVLQDPHGRAGLRTAGHRRAVPLHPRQRGLPRLLPADPDPGLRRQVGAPPGPGDDPQRGVLADPGAVRPGLRHPRGLPDGDRGRGQGRGHVRRRDDRRGQPQDGDQVRVAAASGPG